MSTYKPFKFYAWQGKDNIIGYEAASRYGYVFVEPSKLVTTVSKVLFVNAEETADFVSVSTFKRSLYQNRNKFYLKKELDYLYSIQYCFVDIDSDVILSEEIIQQRCRSHGIPLPTYIINTSTNHYQCIWKLKDELELRYSKMLNYWRIIQKSLYTLFKDLGADNSLILEPKYYIRNPNKTSANNIKYIHHPEIKSVVVNGKVTLSAIYYPLKNKNIVQYYLD